MATAVIERTIIMLAPVGTVVNEDTIRQDALILQAAGLSQGNHMWLSGVQVDTLSGSTYAIRTGVSLVFTLLATEDATVTAGAAAFIARWSGWTILTHARNMQLG
jgi:hypothetical protein